MTRRCDLCVFWRQEYEDGRGRMGKCHINPPRYDPQQGSVFPLTGPSDWCGRFTSPEQDGASLLASLSVDDSLDV